MKNEKSQQGITLIALVVTIVVLLILAGITIAFVLSDGGIFQSAKDAKVEQMRATIMDYAVQIQPTLTTKYYANVAKGESASKCEIVVIPSDRDSDDKNHEISIFNFFPGGSEEWWIEFRSKPYYGWNTSNGVIEYESFFVSKVPQKNFTGEGNIFEVSFDSEGKVSVTLVEKYAPLTTE